MKSIKGVSSDLYKQKISLNKLITFFDAFFFMQKSKKDLWFCVNYQRLNILTVKNFQPILQVKKMLHKLAKRKWYSKSNIIATFYLIRIAYGNEWETIFCTYYYLYKCLIISFKLDYTRSCFHDYIHNTIREYVDIFLHLIKMIYLFITK